MLEHRSFVLGISAPAQSRLTESLAAISNYEPVTILSLGRNRGERNYRWIIGFHDLHVVRGESYRGMLVNASGFDIVIPKEHEGFVCSLVGAMIDLKEDVLVVCYSDTGEVITWEPKGPGSD